MEQTPRPKTFEERLAEMPPIILAKLKRILERKILHYSDNGNNTYIVLDKTIPTSDTVNLTTFLSMLSINGTPQILSKTDALGEVTTLPNRSVIFFRPSSLMDLVEKLGYKDLFDITTIDSTVYEPVKKIELEIEEPVEDIGSETIHTRPSEM